MHLTPITWTSRWDPGISRYTLIISSFNPRFEPLLNCDGRDAPLVTREVIVDDKYARRIEAEAVALGKEEPSFWGSARGASSEVSSASASALTTAQT